MECKNSILFNIKEIELLIKKRILKIYKDCGIEMTPGQSKLLIYIKENSDRDIYQKDLEKLSSLSKSTLSSVLTTMEKNALIVRAGSEKDKRHRKILLTDKAIEISDNVEKELKNIENSLLNNIDKNKFDVFIEVINSIKENIK